MAKCDQCEVAVINGVACHETGCVNSWKHPLTGKGYIRKCAECGDTFHPTEKLQSICIGCQADAEYDTGGEPDESD